MRGDIRERYFKDGFYIIDDFLSAEEIDVLIKEGDNLIKNIPEQSSRSILSNTNFQQNKDQYFLESADKISYFFEAGALGPEGELIVEPNISVNKIAHALHDENKVFRTVTFDERVKEVCFQLGFKEPAVVQSMYIFKNPGVGSEVTPHQDATFLYTNPVNLIGFWIALEDVTLENGCLWFARGSHKGGVHRRYIRNPDTTSKELLIFDAPTPHYQKSSFTAAPVRKGSCVLIHGQVLHYSESNKSENSRHAYSFHIIEQKNTKYPKNNWLQLPNNGSFMDLYKN